MLEIENLQVAYPDGTLAVQNFSLQVEPGENVALIGANGAGKTSVFMALTGIVPGTGRVVLNGVTLQKDTVAQFRQKLGMVFQNPEDQLFMPNVYEDVAFGPRNMGLTPEQVEQRVQDCLEQLQITRLAPRTALKLSGGEKRMAALAGVLAMRPEMLLLDEPTAFLDPGARRRLLQVLRRLPQAKLIATHDLTFACELCPRCVLMQQGKIAAVGPARTILYDRELTARCGIEDLPTYCGMTPAP